MAAEKDVTNSLLDELKKAFEESLDAVITSEAASLKIDQNQIVSDEHRKVTEVYRVLGRTAASVWHGAYMELRQVGVDNDSSITAAFELTNGIVQPIIEHFIHNDQTKQQMDNETRMTEFLNQLLSSVHFHTPGN